MTVRRIERAAACLAGLALVAVTAACEPEPKAAPPPSPTFTLPPLTLPPTAPPTGAPGTGERERKILADAAGLRPLLDAFWTAELARLYDDRFDPPGRFEWYRGTGNQACGTVARALPKNAYYCPVDSDEYVAFDMDWFEGYLREHPGGATTFLVLAHEWGHAVQDAWLENGGNDVWNPPYLRELNADCLAGVFLAHAIRNGTITEEDGDAAAMWEWLFEAGGGTWLEPSSHGTPEQRRTAFAYGYTKDTSYCRVNY